MIALASDRLLHAVITPPMSFVEALLAYVWCLLVCAAQGSGEDNLLFVYEAKSHSLFLLSESHSRYVDRCEGAQIH